MQRVAAAVTASSLRPKTAYAALPKAAAAALSSPARGETLLLVIHNRTRDVVSLKVEAQTPFDRAFLESLRADLLPEGKVFFSASVGNEMTVDFLAGAHVLQGTTAQDLALRPGHGLKQKMLLYASAPGLYSKTLLVEVESVEEVAPSLKPLGECLSLACIGQERGAALLEAVQTLPPQCTVLWPVEGLPEVLRSLSARDLLAYLTVPLALFVQGQGPTLETTLDNTSVKIQPLFTGEVNFELRLKGSSAEKLLLTAASSAPLRSRERFQLVYPCRVAVR